MLYTFMYTGNGCQYAARKCVTTRKLRVTIIAILRLSESD